MPKSRFLFALLCAGLACTAVAGPARRVLNVVNFVRALDPRKPKAEYVRALDEEVKLNLKYGFPNTVLLQYDALVDAEMLATARKSDPAKTEFGFWFEMSRPLNEAAGLEWKPTAKHRDWNWDWFINPGFLMAYDHDGRRRLVDAAFAKFKETFGHYPKSVGSWLLDAWSMDYMAEKYGVDGFCICREQDNTDAYGLRGGYSNGAYYPSKKNMLSAAVEMKNAVRAPVFKMLTPDPIHNYGCPDRLYADYPYKSGCPTLEPVWNTGFEPRIVDWFFRVYTEPKGLLNLSYMQAGQENSFGWNMISKGWPMQCAKIAAEAKAGRIVVETMGETARRFKADHPANCPQTQIALEDWNGDRRRSVWYNSRFYRANLILEGGRLVFRDIHKMADDFEEPFLNKKCVGWQALYFTPPVVDQWLFRDGSASGTMAFDGTFASLTAEPAEGDALVVKAVRPSGACATVRFEEGKVTVTGAELAAEYAPAFRKTVSVGTDELAFAFSGYRYRVPVTGTVAATERGFHLSGGTVSLDLSAPPRGERLYNGIELPATWPPHLDASNQGPMPVPYLRRENIPSPIPVDLGRQLFVDDFLVESAEGVARIYNHPVKFAGNPVLRPETSFEINRPRNSVALPKGGGMWWDESRKVFRLWYEAGWCNRIAYAESADGLAWTRPDLGFDKETPNRLLLNQKVDSWNVFYDPDTPDASARWKLQCQPGRAAARGGANELYVSADGFNWRHLGKTGRCNDRSSMFYNPFRRKWVFSIRDQPFWTERFARGRCRGYWEADTFTPEATAWDWNSETVPPGVYVWQQADRTDPVDPDYPDPPQLYNFDAVAYESIMLGFREIHHGPDNAECARHGMPKITDLVFAYSRDGFHFSCPDRTPAIASERWASGKWDAGYVQPLGNLCVVMGDELWFYYGAFAGNRERLEPDRNNNCAFNGIYDQGAMGLAKLRRDGFAGLKAATEGVVTTRRVTFSGRHLFVNVSAPAGAVSAEALNDEGRPVVKFRSVGGDSTRLELRPVEGSLSDWTGRPVRFRFHLRNATLYSFWISPSPRGESTGYLAGGGPGHAGVRDL